jgi:acyl-CoA dehydrogenase
MTHAVGSATPPQIPFTPPLADIQRALRSVGLADLCALPDRDELDDELALEVIHQFARFAASTLNATDRVGDAVGVVFAPGTGDVAVPASFHKAYAQYVDGGFGGVSFDARDGGGGFPQPVSTAIQELFASSNLAFSLCQILTQGAAALLSRWGTDDQKDRYLPQLLTGA